MYCDGNDKDQLQWKERRTERILKSGSRVRRAEWDAGATQQHAHSVLKCQGSVATAQRRHPMRPIIMYVLQFMGRVITANINAVISNIH